MYSLYFINQQTLADYAIEAFEPKISMLDSAFFWTIFFSFFYLLNILYLEWILSGLIFHMNFLNSNSFIFFFSWNDLIIISSANLREISIIILHDFIWFLYVNDSRLVMRTQVYRNVLKEVIISLSLIWEQTLASVSLIV